LQTAVILACTRANAIFSKRGRDKGFRVELVNGPSSSSQVGQPDAHGLSYAEAVQQRQPKPTPTITEVHVPVPNPAFALRLLTMQTDLKLLQYPVGPTTLSTVTEANAAQFTNQLDNFEINLKHLQTEMEK
jgi:hypothetical protein